MHPERSTSSALVSVSPTPVNVVEARVWMHDGCDAIAHPRGCEWCGRGARRVVRPVVCYQVLQCTDRGQRPERPAAGSGAKSS